MKRILVIATVDWAQITRLCLVLADAGLRVRALAPGYHGLHKMRTIDVELLDRAPTAALRSISRAVERFHPDLVVPGDPRAIYYLHSLYWRSTRGHGTRSRLMAELIETSLGTPSSFVFSRQGSRFVQLAHDEGLLVPATTVVKNVRQLRASVAGARFPLVLKRDESAGGQGVRIVTNAKEAERNFIELRLAGGRTMALMRTLDSRDASNLARFFKPNPAIILQEYIEGRPASRAVVCCQGRVLAGLSAEALQTSGPTRPASVVHIIDSPDMTEAAAFLVQRLGLSGFVGFDFMINAGSGQAYLLEMNGRPTPISHIALDGSTDMISALAQPFVVTRKVPNIDSPVVALFPQEIWRDPESGYLRSAHHDVPRHAVDFVSFYADPVAPEPEGRLQRVASQYVRGHRSDFKVGRSARSRQYHEPAGRCVHEGVAEPSAVHSMKGTATMLQTIDVAIVGAGPYGLSIAAHLSQLGVPFRIFGKPMESWLTQMPGGMLLKSEGFASSIYHPEGRLTLGQYCQEEGLPYADIGLPVPLETFCEYGLAFQRQFVSKLEQKLVAAIDRSPSGFTVKLDSGETVAARRVIVAAGISHFSYVPSSIEGFPRKFVSHSSEHADLRAFRGSDVVVLGGGASAVDVAALLHETGANARLVARRPALELHSKGDGPRSLWRRLRAPNTGIGPSWKSWFFTHCATIFHRLPEGRRLKWVQNHLGPAGGWFMTDRISCVPQLLGYTPIGATVIGNRVRLELATEGGRCSHTVEADHVIAATGYRPRLDRLTFIQPKLRASINVVVNTPILSAHFQSSVAGLYFVGPIAANSFGPLMRFAVGAKYTARRLSQHLAVTTEEVRFQTDGATGMGELPKGHTDSRA